MGVKFILKNVGKLKCLYKYGLVKLCSRKIAAS